MEWCIDLVIIKQHKKVYQHDVSTVMFEAKITGVISYKAVHKIKIYVLEISL